MTEHCLQRIKFKEAFRESLTFQGRLVLLHLPSNNTAAFLLPYVAVPPIVVTHESEAKKLKVRPMWLRSFLHWGRDVINQVGLG